MASLASAGIVVVSPDPTSGSIETDPIGVEVAQQAHFVGITGAGSITPTLMYGGTLAEFTDYTGADAGLTGAVDAAIAAFAPGAGMAGGPSTAIYFAAYFTSSDPPEPVIGQLVDLAVDGEVEVYLLDDNISAVFSAVAIPEPITFALLGLGGLFLRRRK